MKTSEIINRIKQQKKELQGSDELSSRDLSNPKHLNPEPEKISSMITKVMARPNPFFTTITLDVVCEQSRHTIVRMFNMDNKIVKMFSWYLVKGTNVTTINELNSLHGGTYFVDIIDTEGTVLYGTRLIKE